MQAPNFFLPDQNGKIHTLDKYKGKWVVLYFYPKDDTPGCTKESCGFRDLHKEFEERNAIILGVSKDNVASHKKFADKYKLRFTLLSDESKETIKAYGAWGTKSFMGKSFDGVLRTTVLIDPQGNIVKKYEKVDPSLHPEEILKDLPK